MLIHNCATRHTGLNAYALDSTESATNFIISYTHKVCYTTIRNLKMYRTKSIRCIEIEETPAQRLATLCTDSNIHFPEGCHLI